MVAHLTHGALPTRGKLTVRNQNKYAGVNRVALLTCPDHLWGTIRIQYVHATLKYAFKYIACEKKKRSLPALSYVLQS